MTIYFRMIQHLVPRARAWLLVMDAQFRQFMVGLSSISQDARLFFDAMWDDLQPSTTNQLDLWNDQWGLPETGLSTADQRTRLDAAWKKLGGQSPDYIETTLQANGFNVFVHEFWGAGAAPAVPYVAPTPVAAPGGLVDADLLVNMIRTVSVEGLGAGDDDMEAGEDEAEAGNFFGITFGEVEYTVPVTAEENAYMLYISAAAFPARATVDVDRKQEFKILLRSICPQQQWLGLLVTYV